MPSRSMPESCAASLRTNWSRWPSASLGNRLPTIVYRPAARWLQSAMILSKPVPLAPPYRFTTVPSGPLEQAASEVINAATPTTATHRDGRRAVPVGCRTISDPPTGLTLAYGAGHSHDPRLSDSAVVRELGTAAIFDFPGSAVPALPAPGACRPLCPDVTDIDSAASHLDPGSDD